MLAPVGMVNNRIEDREPWKQPGRRPPKPGKKKKDPDASQPHARGEHIDIKA